MPVAPGRVNWQESGLSVGTVGVCPAQAPSLAHWAGQSALKLKFRLY
jgi:hypothetical protein